MSTNYQYTPLTHYDCPSCGAPGAMRDNLHWDGCSLARQSVKALAKERSKARRARRILRTLKFTA